MDLKDSATRRAIGRKVDLLERLTACVLVLVVVSLAWMIAAANGISWVRFGSEATEVVVMAGLFTVALLLVSIVALIQTRE